MKIKNMNLKIILQIAILLGYAAFFLRSIWNGTVSMYVHPRIIPFLIFAAAAMVVIAVLLRGTIIRGRGEKGSLLPLLFYAIPVIMAFTIPPQSFDSNTATIREVQLKSGTYGSSNLLSHHETQQEKSQKETSGLADEVTETKTTPEENPEDTKSMLYMDTDNFVDCMNDVYDDIDSYIGMPIEAVGFVYRDENQFKTDEFVTARLMMVCCAADMQPVGFLCRYDKTGSLKADTWVKVDGTIDKTEFGGDTIPYIKVDNVQPAEKPDNDYIYPY
jgi:putative membrane protein